MSVSASQPVAMLHCSREQCSIPSGSCKEICHREAGSAAARLVSILLTHMNVHVATQASHMDII